MDDKNRRKSQLRQTNLETANAMFKNAFLMKKTRFAKENPSLSENEVDKMTADYFLHLPRENIKGQLG